MGLPVIDLVSPIDSGTSETIVVFFDAMYTDPIDSLAADTILFEIDTVNTFNSTDLLKATYVTQASGTTIRTIESLKNGRWYWRVTATNSSGTTVSSVNSFIVAQNIKRVLYQYIGVAKAPVPLNKRVLYQYEDVAKYGPDWTNKRGLYQYNDVMDDPPFPYIERLSSTRGAVGTIVTIHGNGFGASYDIDITNVDRSIRGYGGYVFIGELVCNIVSWSWTEIVFQIPAEAVTGAVKVQLTVPTIRDSNLIGFEVYEGVPADDIGVELFICDKTNPNTVLCQLDGAKNKAFQVLLNNPGSGGFSISRYDKNGGNRAYISDQNFVLCKVDGIDVFKWIIESRKPNYIDSGEQQMIEVSGRGVLGMLNWAVVYPENMGTPVLDRSFTGKAGAILKTLLLEAQARGCLKGVSIDWTSDADSVGNPFLDTTTISFHVGTPLLEVAKKFTEGMGLFDIEMTPELKLRIYKVKGEDKYETVKYRPGQAIISHQNQSDATNVINEVLLEGADGTLAIADHSTSQAEWGRREGYLQASNIKDGLSEYGQMYLNKSAYANWGIQGTVTKFVESNGNKIKPFETFLNGDWIGWFIPPEGTDTTGFDGKLRVKGITVEEDDDTGNLSYTLELNNIMLETEIKMAQSVERLAKYSGNDALSNPSTVTPAPLDHNHTHSLLTGLDLDDHPQYYNEERHASDSHNSIQRVSSLKKPGGNALTGDVSLVAGSNIVITQNDEAKSITIASIGGSTGGGAVYSRAIDIPPSYPSLMDDEFDGTALDSKWTILSKLSNETVTVENGSLILEVPTGSTKHRRLAVVQSTPSGTWKVRAKCASEGLSWNYFGIFLLARRTTGGIDKNVYCGLMAHSSFGFWTGYAGTMNTETLVSEVDLCNYAGSEFYLELEYDGTNLIWRISTTGVRFRHMWTQALTTFLGGAPDQVGIMIHPYDNTGSGWSGLGTFDWFRRIS